jgi:hypothetical protein
MTDPSAGEPDPLARAGPTLPGDRLTYLEQLIAEDGSRRLTEAEFDSQVAPFLAAGDGEG